MRFEIVPRQSCALPRHAAKRTLRCLCVLREPSRNTRNEVIDEKLVEFAIQFAKCCEQRSGEDGVPDYRLIDERQPDLLRIQAFEQQRRLQIQHSILQPVIGSGTPIVLFIRVKDDHLPRQAEPLLSAIGKRLHTLQRDP